MSNNTTIYQMVFNSIEQSRAKGLEPYYLKLLEDDFYDFYSMEYDVTEVSKGWINYKHDTMLEQLMLGYTDLKCDLGESKQEKIDLAEKTLHEIECEIEPYCWTNFTKEDFRKYAKRIQ